MKKTKIYRLGTLAAVVTVFFGYAWENVQATRLGYGIEGVRREITDLRNANNYLRKEIQSSMSPEKLQAGALKIGLVYPEPDALVLLDSDTSDKPAKGWLARLFRLGSPEI